MTDSHDPERPWLKRNELAEILEEQQGGRNRRLLFIALGLFVLTCCAIIAGLMLVAYTAINWCSWC